MPGSTATIDSGQRTGIYELVRNHLAGLSDVFVAMEERATTPPPSGWGLSSAKTSAFCGTSVGRRATTAESSSSPCRRPT